MKEGDVYTPEEVKAMGYDPDVVDFFKQNNPVLLGFMWGNDSAPYNSILKNEIPSNYLIPTARLQITLEQRIGNGAASCLLMAEYRLNHPQTLVSSEKK
jgi:hypothetical protein